MVIVASLGGKWKVESSLLVSLLAGSEGFAARVRRENKMKIRSTIVGVLGVMQGGPP